MLGFPVCKHGWLKFFQIGRRSKASQMYKYEPNTDVTSACSMWDGLNHDTQTRQEDLENSATSRKVLISKPEPSFSCTLHRSSKHVETCSTEPSAGISRQLSSMHLAKLRLGQNCFLLQCKPKRRWGFGFGGTSPPPTNCLRAYERASDYMHDRDQ